ncbi:MbtH-like protein (plasmid) [Candidatus Trichorickettsia mobilis]|jgi:MbtH protein|uniref:MbtH family protein n=1 Tax=Candidatus Trichorickettsia mobilis TaxID=1346319 RepID=UPI002B256D75|nr:MbtH family NRPS accessory protein [Candidatus Trichorickettsia mobilis]WPY01797.1 MbtH-like protein [Candidatus Trichorickettsia mobilis]
MSEEKKYLCLINEEEQYSLWFENKHIPLGWKQVGPVGNKEDCLQYIKEAWQDMRPKSLRDKMESKRD